MILYFLTEINGGEVNFLTIYQYRLNLNGLQISFKTLDNLQKTVTPAKRYQSLSLAFPLCFPKAMGTAAAVSSLEKDLSESATATGPLAASKEFISGYNVLTSSR